MTTDRVKLRILVLLIALLASFGVYGAVAGSVQASTWISGDVFTSTATSQWDVWSNTGTFKETITLPGPYSYLYTAGCAFSPGTVNRLYTTDYSQSHVVAFSSVHPHNAVLTIDTTLASGGVDSGAEGIVFPANANYFYVGHADGSGQIHKYSLSGTLIATYPAARESRGTDWIDLSANQKTIFYTSEGRKIKRYRVVGAGAQLSDFATLPPGNTINSVAYALKLLPPASGGGLLVADTDNVKRLNGFGVVVQTYDVTGEDDWFGLALDPNGTSFWATDGATNNFYEFNIATGAVQVGPINTATGGRQLAGICVRK